MNEIRFCHFTNKHCKTNEELVTRFFSRAKENNNTMSRQIIQVFEEYQKSRVKFVQTVADLASRPQHGGAAERWRDAVLRRCC